MKRGCLLSLLIWAALGAGYYFYLHGRVEPPGDWVAALIGSLFATLGIGALRNAAHYARLRRMVADRTRTRMPKSGEMIACAGRIYAKDAPLKSPFTDQDAVFVTYKAYDETVHSSKSGSSRTENVKWSGFQLTPCYIRSNFGDVRLLAFPTLNGWSEDLYDGPETVEKARAFVARTQFEEMGGMQVRKMFSQMKDLLSDDDGTISKNWMMEKEAPLEGLYFEEQFVQNGDEVCAMGVYDQMKGGIIAQYFGAGTAVELFRGDRASVLKIMRGKIVGGVVMAIFFLVIVNVVGAFVLYQSLNAESQVRKRTEKMYNALESEKIDEARAIARFPIDANKADSSGETMLMRARNAEAVRLLLEHGAKVESRDSNGRNALMRAAQNGRADVVQALLDAKADLKASDNWGETALSFAQDNRAADVVTLLLKAGAVNDEVTAENGRRLTEKDDPVKVCFQYIAAIHKRDPKLMASYFVTRGEDFFKEVDFEVWTGSRPKTPELLEGYANESRAMIKIGERGGQGSLNFEYKLEKIGSGWKISKERIAE